MTQSNIKKSDDIIFFPTLGHFDKEEKLWVLPIHGWIFEPEASSFKRRLFVGALKKKLGDKIESSDLFEKRVRAFLVDNQDKKQIKIILAEQTFELSESSKDGHFLTELRLPPAQVSEFSKDGFLPFRAITDLKDARVFEGGVRLIESEGVSVISDIDDTIKHTHVTDRTELLSNTFLRAFKAVPGMPELYDSWLRKGAQFHFVSASPWQLFQSLKSFIDETGFPDASYSLRRIRIKSWSDINKLKDEAHLAKLPLLEEILDKFPNRNFILVGDSGERDPEIYGKLAECRPGQLTHVFIRDVSKAGESAGRFEKAFGGIPSEKWTIFKSTEKGISKDLEKFVGDFWARL